MERQQAHQRINGHFQNFFWRVVRHFFNFHTAFGRSHEGDTAGRTVNHCTEVQLTLYRVHVFAHQHAVDRLAVGIGLVSDQIFTDQAVCHVCGFFTAFHHFHATCLTTATGMDLGFDDSKFAAHLIKRSRSFFTVGGEDALLHRQAIFSQQLFRLVFVQIHRLFSSLV